GAGARVKGRSFMDAIAASTATPNRALPPGAAERYAMVLLAVAASAMGYSSQRWVLAGPLIILSLSYPLLGPYLTINIGLIGQLVLAIPFAVMSNSWKIEHATLPGFTTTAYGGFYLILFAILRLYAPTPQWRLEAATLSSGLALAGAGSEVQTAHDKIVYAGFALFYMLMLFGMLRASLAAHTRIDRSHFGRRLWLTAAFIASGLLVLPGMALVDAYYLRLSNYLIRLTMEFLPQAAPGFSQRSRLGDLIALRDYPGAERIAVRAFAPQAAGYLRGKVYLTYSHASWSADQNFQEYRPDRGPNKEKSVGRLLLPGRPPVEEFAAPDLWLFNAEIYRAHFFLPLVAAALDTASERVAIMPGMAVQSLHRSTAVGYGVILGSPPIYDPPRDRDHYLPSATPRAVDAAYLDLPRQPECLEALTEVIAQLDSAWQALPRHQALAAARAHYAQKPQEAVQAIAGYFVQHYKYQLGVTFPPGRDPIYEFLRPGGLRHGHCELFASAGALLLRQLGIPSRYVTGFVCQEPNPYAKNLWVARQRDAHAWVEYFDRHAGWRTAEFTPVEGRPEVKIASGWTAWREWLAAQWQRLRGYFRREGLSGLLALLGQAGFWLIATWPRRIAVAVCLLAFFLSRGWQKRRRRAKQRVRHLAAEVERLRQAYFQLEKRLAQYGLQRTPSETLAEFAKRVEGTPFPGREEAVRLIRHLDELRYTPQAAAAPKP
ncbi:MAG: transglutaminase domain-containing protein, partial [Planctomycetota bacterium]|nr:transglutaminase domain-containing protein [Planctomycetota bacterium]